MSPKKAAVLAAGAILVVLLAPCARGQGTQSNPPPASGATPEQNVQAQSLPGRIHVDIGELHAVHQFPPAYPPIARVGGIQGTVVLRVVIGKGGEVRGLQYVAGPPLLMYEAANAVRRWKYRPYFVKGRPVEVETTVWVHFGLLPPEADEAVAGNPILAAKLQGLLRGNIHVADAAHGYQGVHDFEIALYASRDLNIPFVQFRCVELGGQYCDPATTEKPKNAAKTIETLKPGMSKGDVKRALKTATEEAMAAG